MYKVLLVDDERIILEGISKIIEWEKLHTMLVGKATNGIEAYQLIVDLQPDIVISDIKMPGMNGMELVSKIKEEYPHIHFILLSGFAEFHYAQKGMEYGVKHYLLKPCNENQIIEAIQQISSEIRMKEKKEHYLIQMKKKMETVQPFVKKQLLTELVTSKKSEKKVLAYYERIFHTKLEDKQICVVLFHLEGDFNYEHLFMLENVGNDIFESPILSSNIGEHILFIVDAKSGQDELQERMKQIRKNFSLVYEMDMTVAVSRIGSITLTRKLYQEALECLSHRFYLGEGSIITKKDIQQEQEIDSLDFGDLPLFLEIKSGNWAKAEEEMNEIFEQISAKRDPIHLTRTHIIQLFLSIIQVCCAKSLSDYMGKISFLLEAKSIQAMKEFLLYHTKEITFTYYDKHKSSQSHVIEQIKELINKELSNPALSLKWVATQVYMNADYLGKLFKQETGEKFSTYVTRMRVNKALEEIEKTDEIKIFTLAEMSGFGDNPQYFSQVFKKHTGYTPSEYKNAR